MVTSYENPAVSVEALARNGEGNTEGSLRDPVESIRGRSCKQDYDVLRSLQKCRELGRNDLAIRLGLRVTERIEE